MAETQQTKIEEQEDHSNGWLGDFVRLTIMIWAMGVITANYLGMFKQSIDVTFQRKLAEFNGCKLRPVGRPQRSKEERREERYR